MGSVYSIKHAAVLAEQLPLSARTKSVDELQGLSFEEALLVQIEYNTRIAWWMYTDAAKDGNDKPVPLVDFGSADSRGKPMDIDALEKVLSANRKEVE